MVTVQFVIEDIEAYLHPQLHREPALLSKIANAHLILRIYLIVSFVYDSFDFGQLIIFPLLKNLTFDLDPRVVEINRLMPQLQVKAFELIMLLFVNRIELLCHLLDLEELPILMVAHLMKRVIKFQDFWTLMGRL